MSSRAITISLSLVFLTHVLPAQTLDWESEQLQQLGRRYTEGPGGASLDAIAAAMGERLASGGSGGVPAEDLATLALLVARQAAQGEPEVPPTVTPAPVIESPEDGDDLQVTDLSKGEEGVAQAIERLRELPLSERLVVTGDIATGIQAAPLPSSSDLTSAYGRARLNFVARALPGSADGRTGDGLFFVQFQSAGGAVDTSAVGGPGSFNSLNDIATNRSAFNEGLSRGNVYLNKVFFQQERRMFGGSVQGRIGVIDLTDFFDTNEFANNEMRQFLNSSFVNAPAFKGGVGAPGAMAEYTRTLDRGSLREAVVRAGYAVSRSERAFTSPLWNTEVELRTLLSGKRGSWRFGSTIGNVADVGSVRGFHFNFDHWLSSRSGVFGRFSASNAGPGSLALGPVRRSYSGGYQRRFFDEDEDVSAWGVAFSSSSGIETGMRLETERVLETYYRWQLSEGLSLTPDFQFVVGSNGRSERAVYPVLGLRVAFGL